MPLEVDEGTVRHSGQTELVDRNYEEHCASIPSDRRSDQLDEILQVYVTMLAVTTSIELQSNTAQSALAQVSNAMFRVENNKTAVKNRVGSHISPVTNSKTSGDTRNHPDRGGGTWRWGRRG